MSIDVAREGRRFAGRRAARVLREVAELLGRRLPPGARLRQDQNDGLSVVLQGWTPDEATGWMHGSLPDLLGRVSAEELTGMALRAAVHDTGGPVGGQLLQSLDIAARRQPEPAETAGRNALPADPEGADPDGQSLAELLAGALAAYRGI